MTLPPKYTTNQTFSADSDLPYLFGRYLLGQFEYARSLENGIQEDRDPEYLHQYRVSLRRCRSLIKLLKELLPPFECNLISTHLVTLMKPTNLLRDLDVFLLSKRNYLSGKAKHQQAIETLFEGIASERKQEQARVKAWLNTPDYTATCAMLRNSLMRSVTSDSLPIQYSTKSFASIKILTYQQKVLSKCTKISKKSPDAAVHKVRIECKKLRYLLEYFAPLYIDNNHKKNVARLKSLQDKLGDVNDSSTQLAHFIDLRDKSEQSKSIRKTLNSLVCLTQKQHELAREAALEQIKTFRNCATNTGTWLLYEADKVDAGSKA